MLNKAISLKRRAPDSNHDGMAEGQRPLAESGAARTSTDDNATFLTEQDETVAIDECRNLMSGVPPTLVCSVQSDSTNLSMSDGDANQIIPGASDSLPTVHSGSHIAQNEGVAQNSVSNVSSPAPEAGQDIIHSNNHVQIETDESITPQTPTLECSESPGEIYREIFGTEQSSSFPVIDRNERFSPPYRALERPATPSGQCRGDVRDERLSSFQFTPSTLQRIPPRSQEADPSILESLNHHDPKEFLWYRYESDSTTSRSISDNQGSNTDQVAHCSVFSCGYSEPAEMHVLAECPLCNSVRCFTVRFED